MEEKDVRKTERIRKFNYNDHKNEVERCKTERDILQYILQNLAEHGSKLIFFWYTQNFMQHIIVSMETSCQFYLIYYIFWDLNYCNRSRVEGKLTWGWI